MKQVIDLNSEYTQDNTRYHTRLAYLLPANLRVEDIIGKGGCILKQIESNANADVKFNDKYRQIEISGLKDNVEKVKLALNYKIEMLLKRVERKPRGDSWFRRRFNEEEINKELSKTQCELDQQKELEPYLKPIELGNEPDHKQNLLLTEQLIDEADFKLQSNFLNSIRRNQQVWILPLENRGKDNEKIKLIGYKIIGYKKGNVTIAAKKVQYLAAEKILENRKPTIFNVLKIQSYINMIQIKQSVLHNRLPFNITRIGLLMNCSNLENGDIIEDIDNEEIQKENLRPLKILKDGLRSCLVYRGLLKLSLRFGKICFLDLPKKLVFPSHDFQQRVLNNPNFTSDFSRNIFYGQSNKFNELLIQLSTEGHEYLNNPQTIYTLKCDCINLFDKNEFDLNLCFDNSKLIKYDCISPYKLTTAINWCFVEDDNSLDFQLGLEKAVRLDIHNPDLIEFIKNLNLSAAGQFSYCNTSKIKVRSIIKKVRHCYELQRYKFQATKSELWIFEHKYLTNTFKHVIQSVDIQPNIITVDLKIINESWNSYFTQNLNLKKGNIVEYDYRNVMSNEDYSKLIKLAINWRHKINEL